MNDYVTRAEHDAKLNAAEERTNAQLSRLEAKMDSGFTEIRAEMKVMSTELHAAITTITTTLNDYRKDARASKWALWSITVAAWALFVTLLLQR